MAEQPQQPVRVPTGEGGGEGAPPPTDSPPPLPPKPPPPDSPPPALPPKGEKVRDGNEELLTTGAREEAPKTSVLPPKPVVPVVNGEFLLCMYGCAIADNT